MSRQLFKILVCLLICFTGFGSLVTFIANDLVVEKRHATEPKPMMNSKGVIVIDLTVNSYKELVGLGCVSGCKEMFPNRCAWVEHATRVCGGISFSGEYEPRCGGAGMVPVAVNKVWQFINGQKFDFDPFAYIQCQSLASVKNFCLYSDRLAYSPLKKTFTKINSEPCSLINSHLTLSYLDCFLSGSSGILRGFSRLLHFRELHAHLVKLPLHYTQLASINASLPNAHPDCAESGDHQCPSKPSQPCVRFDLRTCELVLLILASLTGCFSLFCWSIKNDSIPFSVVGGGYVILFLIGQLAVYLPCRRIYGI